MKIDYEKYKDIKIDKEKFKDIPTNVEHLRNCLAICYVLMEDKDKEIERLNNELELQNIEMGREIERLNENNQAMQEEMARTWKKLDEKENIITELEKWLLHHKKKVFGKNGKVGYLNYGEVLVKLKELKNCTKESQNDAIKSNDEAIKRINKALAYIKENAWYDYRDNEEVITISKEKLLEILGSDKE